MPIDAITPAPEKLAVAEKHVRSSSHVGRSAPVRASHCRIPEQKWRRDATTPPDQTLLRRNMEIAMILSTNLMKMWFWPWEAAQLTARLMETCVATQSVLGARLPMIADAITNPIGANHGELTRMVTEKVSAFGRSHGTMAAAGRAVQRTGEANAAAFGRLAGGGLLGPAEWMSIFERNVALATTLMALPMQAMAPVHSGVTANARRLGKR